jgi:hypothetical protein
VLLALAGCADGDDVTTCRCTPDQHCVAGRCIAAGDGSVRLDAPGSDAGPDGSSERDGGPIEPACGDEGEACCDGGGAPCVASLVCRSGFCTAACGTPGAGCCAGGTCTTPGTTCTAGTCTGCGTLGAPCCGTTCATATICSGGTCEACGAAGQACCSGGACSAGAVCSASGCVTCGGVDQPCCTSGTPCGAGATCDATGRCEPCGGAREPCCGIGMGICASAHYCWGGTCWADPVGTMDGLRGEGLCADHGTDAGTPLYVVTITGRPGAAVTYWTTSTCAPGAPPAPPTLPPGTSPIPADGVLRWNYLSAGLGETVCPGGVGTVWAEVDGRSTSMFMETEYNSRCTVAPTCAAARSYCPPPPP